MDDDTSQALLDHTESLNRLYGGDMSDINNRLMEAMKELAGAKNGKLNFRGRLYATVALRVEMLRKHLCADVSVVTDIVSLNDETVVIKATISRGDLVLATGYAEEHRSGKGVNSTSALENCETSAVGRALAALGLGGGEYASADELTGAVNQQKALEDAIKTHSKSIKVIQDNISKGDLSKAAEAWFELSDDDKQALWVAPSKGGPFTTRERETMKTPGFREAYYGAPEEA